jgi:fatty acid amide hydrolase
LRVGVWRDDGYFSAAPALRRAVNEAASALRDAGVAVVEITPPDVKEVVSCYFGLLSADGGADFRHTLGRSAVDWRIRRLFRLGMLPAIGRRQLSAVLQLAGQRRMADLVVATGRASASRYWQLTAMLTDYTNRFIALLDAARLDACLCPPHALPALRHGSTAHLPSAASYCFLPNLLNMPAGVVPATRIRPGEETDRPASRDRVEQAALAVERGSAGLPVGVQVFARHWREDVVLALLGLLEGHFKRQPDFPAEPPI